MNRKNLYIIAGCNGAGKTTASFTILPEFLNCKEFVNADEIARGLSPFQPESVAFEAGRIMLTRINELIMNGKSFAFEKNLASKSYKSKILAARQKDYRISLLFFWLRTMDLAVERVKSRVEEGGHKIPGNVIKRRFKRGIVNLFEIFIPIVDDIMIFDNSVGKHEIIAFRVRHSDLTVVNEAKFRKLKDQKNEFRNDSLSLIH